MGRNQLDHSETNTIYNYIRKKTIHHKMGHQHTPNRNAHENDANERVPHMPTMPTSRGISLPCYPLSTCPQHKNMAKVITYIRLQTQKNRNGPRHNTSIYTCAPAMAATRSQSTNATSTCQQLRSRRMQNSKRNRMDTIHYRPMEHKMGRMPTATLQIYQKEKLRTKVELESKLVSLGRNSTPLEPQKLVHVPL